MKDIIEVENLTKIYRSFKGAKEVTALDSISLTAKKGEFIGVMGPSGSGKTTLLNILSGVDNATGGTVSIEGHNIAKMKKDELALFRRKKIGYIFQDLRLVFEQNKTTAMYYNFINSYGNAEFVGAIANILDDSVYESIKAQRDTVYLFNLKNGNGDKIFSNLLDVLREKNKADSSLWVSSETKFVEGSGRVYIERDKVESLRPIYKAERFDIKFRMDGFLLFAMTFLGFLFLLSSSIVLYYKVVTDIDDEKEHAALLTKIGLTMGEYRTYLRTHLAIVFFTPMIIGGILGLFLINTALNFTVYSAFLKNRVFMMYGIFIVFDIFFYMSLKNKFIREVGLYIVD